MFKRTRTLTVTLVFIVVVTLVTFVPECKVSAPQKFVPYTTDELKQRVNKTNKLQKQVYSIKGSQFEGHQQRIGKENFKSSGTNETCEKSLPQAIIVGIQKCGTTALLKFLGVHPQIAAYAYEAQYFFGKNETHTLDWYRNLMPCSYSNQITIERSPPYFYRGIAAERIRKINPKTKIIIIVKDPITRAVSMYVMAKEKNKKVHGKSFEDCVTLNDNKTIATSSIFIQFSNYPEHMQAWMDNFDREQILVLDGHNMELNPAEELKKVEHFLYIGHFFTPDKFAFNETKGKYCLKADNYLDCLNSKKGRRHPDIDYIIRKRLEHYFGPLNEEFFKMINKRFDWGY